MRSNNSIEQAADTWLHGIRESAKRYEMKVFVA